MANVVLVHGAFCDGSIWGDVIPLLHKSDHINQVIAVQNPLTGLAGDVANTRAVLAQMDGATIVAGHSYGGTVVSGAAQDAPADVRALVFVAAVTVDEGEAPQDVFERFPTGVLGSGQFLQPPDDRGFLIINRGAFPEMFAMDLLDADRRDRAEVLRDVQKPTSDACFSDALDGPPAWRALPSTFLVSEHDLVIPTDAQRMMAERIGGKTIELSASHASLVSRPREVADAIIEAAVESRVPGDPPILPKPKEP